FGRPCGLRPGDRDLRRQTGQQGTGLQREDEQKEPAQGAPGEGGQGSEIFHGPAYNAAGWKKG
ncbi:MAG: hypothetical protein NTW37_20630, partial [Proteobacteria bacterium]|nr:hypothetical protein [Pseudomonadota bacterium]